MKPIQKVALLHSLCSVGKASLTNMIPVLSAMGIEACPIPTALLSTHTGGYGAPAVQVTPPDYIRNCANHYVQNDVQFDMIFVGYIGNPENAQAIQYFIQQFPKAIVVIDPIMGDHGRFYQNMGQAYADAYFELLPYAALVVPNLTEACILSGHQYQEAKDLCEFLHEKGADNVIITSVSQTSETIDIAFSTGTVTDMLSLPAEVTNFHGTGDLFNAVLLGAFLQDIPLQESILKAHHFVSACIPESSAHEYDKREGLLVEKLLSTLV